MIRALLLAGMMAAAPVAAQNAQARHAPVFPDIGSVAAIDSDVAIPADAVLKVMYDVNAQADAGTVNRKFESAARFLNGHVEAGVPEANIHVAYIVRGKAIIDLLNPAAYAARTGGKTNATAALVTRLLAHQINFYVCGQSAVAQGIARSELLPGVKMAISASSSHALLGNQGYVLIPF